MHHVDLVVPSALVDPALAVDLLRDQSMPYLDRIVLLGAAGQPLQLSSDAALTPWQAWIFGARGKAVERVNIAELWAMACGLAPVPAVGRYVVEPAHFTIANDHLRLDDPRALSITLAEARALATTIEPVLVEAGWRLHPIEPATLTHWPVFRIDGTPLTAPSVERAIADNVAAWQPRASAGSDSAGDVALDWRRCVNEIQMLWFGHPVNEAREANGQPSVNTLWLSGNGAPRGEMPHYAAVDSGLPLLAALPVEPDAGHVLETFDGFIEPMRREDWSGWRDQLAALDARLAAIVQRQAAGTVGTLTLVLCGRDQATTRTIERREAGQAWRGWFRKPPPLVETLREGGPS